MLYKISSQLIDYYDDNKLILDLVDDSAPNFVKSAELLDYEDKIKMSDDSYALVMMTKTGSKLKRYPLFDKAHTWLSCRSFEKTSHLLPIDAVKVAASNLFASCLYNDIPCPEVIIKLADDIETNMVSVDEDSDLPLEYYIKEELYKNASSRVEDDQWGIVTEEGEKLYPLNTTDNINAAIGYFEKNANKMIPEYRYQFAKNIYKHASNNDINVPESISVYSNDRGNRVGYNISSRIPLAKTAEEKEFITKLSKIQSGLSVDALINYISSFDKTAGLNKYYGKHIKDPYLSVLEKVAVEEWGDVSGNDDVQPDEIQNYAKTYASQDLINYLPDDLVNKFLTDPLDAFDGMQPIQQEIIIKGVKGKL